MFFSVIFMHFVSATTSYFRWLTQCFQCLNLKIQKKRLTNDLFLFVSESLSASQPANYISLSMCEIIKSIRFELLRIKRVINVWERKKRIKGKRDSTADCVSTNFYGLNLWATNWAVAVQSHSIELPKSLDVHVFLFFSGLFLFVLSEPKNSQVIALCGCDSVESLRNQFTLRARVHLDHWLERINNDLF